MRLNDREPPNTFEATDLASINSHYRGFPDQNRGTAGKICETASKRFARRLGFGEFLEL